jgi:redox-sensing transcriptional repressor
VRKHVSDSAIRRLSHYLRALEGFELGGPFTVSSEELAERGGTTAAQVRKDLSNFGSFGKRGLGYGVPQLAARLRSILGVDRRWRSALVGAGRIGSALFAYPDFQRRGFDCVAVFDSDPAKIGVCWGDVRIQPADRLEEVMRAMGIELVILAIPADVVQGIAERAVAAGARGILNFAPRQLRLPPGIPLKHVNLVMELEALSFAISQGEPRA